MIRLTRLLVVAAFTMVFAASTGELITLGFGASMSRPDMFAWPAMLLVMTFNVLVFRRIAERWRTIAEHRAQLIRDQGDLLTRLLKEK